MKEVRRSNLTEGPVVQSAMTALSERAGLPSSLQAHSKVERGYIVHGSTATEVFDVHVSRKPMSEHVRVRVDGTTGRVLSITNQMIH